MPVPAAAFIKHQLNILIATMVITARCQEQAQGQASGSYLVLLFLTGLAMPGFHTHQTSLFEPCQMAEKFMADQFLSTAPAI